MSISRTSAVVLAGAGLLVISGCATRVSSASDGGGDVVSSFTTPAPATSTRAAVPVPAACRTDMILPTLEPTPTAIAEPRLGPGPELAPHHADNNAWKHRRPLSPADHEVATKAAEMIRPALEERCGRGDFSIDATRQALIGSGFTTDDFDLTGLRSGAPGLFFSVGMGDRACVNGTMSAASLRIRVEGKTAEGSCIEPFSH